MRSLRSLYVLTAVTVLSVALQTRSTAQLCSSFPTAPYPLECGMSVVTCFSGTDPSTWEVDLNGFVVGVIDARGFLPTNANTCAPMYHHPNWTANDLGQVFGIAMDDASPPNVYVTASTVYSPDNVGPGGSGGIYKLDNVNGAPTVFQSLPNAGATGLGQICFDRATRNFFVTNHEDGRIYCIDLAGNLISTFDHASGTVSSGGAPEAGDTPGFVPLGERLWGVQAYNGKLYYSVWWEDQARPNGNESNEVWSIDIVGAGNVFQSGSEQLEIQVDTFDSTANWSSPVADIDFTSDGRLKIAERSMGSDSSTAAHRSRNLEYDWDGSNWVPSPREFFIGNVFYPGNNSTGGIAHDCDDNLQSTGDGLLFVSGGVVYGLQITPAGGNTLATLASTGSFIDFDGQSSNFKTWAGDVEILNDCCHCATVSHEEIRCNPDNPGTFIYTFDLTNNSGTDVVSGVFLPCDDDGDLIPDFTMTPSSFTTPIADGATSSVSVEMAGVVEGGRACFEIWLFSEGFERCCVIKHCVDVPICCIALVESSIECDPATGDFIWSFSFVNQSGFDIDRLFLWPQAPSGATVSPSMFILTPVPNGSTSPILTTTISGASAGDVFQVDLSVHNSDTGECCYLENVRFTLPECDGGCDKPICSVPHSVQFCQIDGGDLIEARFCLRVCNHCFEQPAEFSFDFTPLSGVLTFIPDSGIVGPLAPGECAQIQVTVESFLGTVPVGGAQYEVNVTNLTTGEDEVCTGRLTNIPQPGEIKVQIAKPADGDVHVGVATPISVRLDNPGEQASVDLVILGDPDGLSLDGLPPGEPVRRRVTVPAGRTAEITFDVEVARVQYDVFFDIILLSYQEGFGISESSIQVRPTTDADCDGDGISDNIAIILGLATDVDQDGVPDECRGGQGALAPPTFRRGDSNADARVDISDGVAALAFLFLGETPPTCLDAADANDDGKVDVSDALSVFGYLFLGSEAPPAPGALHCGLDYSADDLDCEVHEVCP